MGLTLRGVAALVLSFGLFACAGAAGESEPGEVGAVGGPIAGAGAIAPGAPGPAGDGTGTTPSGAPDTSGAPAPGAPPPPAGEPGAVGPGLPTPDATPSGPSVQVPGVDCGPDSTLVWDETNIIVPGLENSGFAGPNFEIGGREIALHYPCKPAGTDVTFILNLHGTMPEQMLKGYQVPYFRVHRYVDSHNLIVVAPKAVGAQWGVFDGGADVPHLMEIIDWVYATFSELNIRSMWVAGHSQGSLFAKDFVCNPAIADKVKGVVAQAGGPLNPLCSDRVSHIHTIGEFDMLGALPDQSGPAAGHGCNPVITGPTMLGNNRYRFHEGCQGFVHSDYLMLGKGHVEVIDAEVVENIIGEMKSVE